MALCAPSAYVLLLGGGWTPEDQQTIGDGEPAWIAGQDVAVRARPSIDAQVITRLSYDLVPAHEVGRADQSGRSLTWDRVALSDGRVGWVESSYIWSYNQRHVCFSEVGGKWMITEFTVGH